ncbi:hypothetical protein CRG98_008758 [Punica granatum]|uniref:Uncharacterized protein n=1 Tax=Punica granatum TaxID=22663 RepID=A0A2I0KQX2_PUNGR|nr:hypothetical protein CRG98_008758 [Punica granatum]
MWTLVGARMRSFGSRGLGVSTFPWGCVTDTRERRSRHLSFYNPLDPHGKQVRKDNKQQGRGQALCRAVTGAWTRGDERADARADVRRVTGACKSAREHEEDNKGKSWLPLGNPWVQWPKRRNREKARVSIGRPFEVRGSN